MTDFAGDWEGSLDVSGQRLPLVFHIAHDEDTWSATMDSPQQSARGIPVDTVTVQGDRITLVITSLGARYEGQLDDRESISGTFTQSGMDLDLKLTRKGAAARGARRPQDPVQPYPYLSEDVAFENADAEITLAGTITRPEGEGPFPGIVLVSGSGQQNRDEEMFDHRPFLVLADALTRAGVAVLRYDDRGVGESGGRDSLEEATSRDFAGDAAAAVGYLRGQAYVAPQRVGMLGHSEGGLIAILLGTGELPGPDTGSVGPRKRPDFLVLLGTAAVSGDELLMMQSRALLEASGASTAYIERITRANRDVYDILLSDMPRDEAAKEIARIQKELGMTDEQIRVQHRQLFSPWFDFFLRTDPAELLRALDIPILAATGSLDLQVPSGPNLTATREALEAAPTSEFSVRELEGLNHLLQPAETGGVEEYGQIETTIAPEALELITRWVAAR